MASILSMFVNHHHLVGHHSIEIHMSLLNCVVNTRNTNKISDHIFYVLHVLYIRSESSANPGVGGLTPNSPSSWPYVQVSLVAVHCICKMCYSVKIDI